jgi:hypothetical protein
MTKEELVETVELVYAIWNKDMPQNADSLKTLYKAWARVLLDAPKDGILEAADRLALINQYLPTPGTLKQEWLRTEPGAAPTPTQAWNQYCAIRDAVNAGTHTPHQVHPRLQAAINQCGLSLHTNDDRRHFTQTYNETTVAETQ